MLHAKKIILSLLLATSLSTPALAQNWTPPSSDASKASSDVYKVDLSHASIVFKINHMGMSMYTGRFNQFDSSINFDPKRPESAHVEAIVDVNSIDTHNAKLEEELKSDKFFDTAKFPTATFKSQHITKSGATSGSMIGELTLHGVTKPVTLNVNFHGYSPNPFTKKDTLGFAATATISRSAFGITNYVPMVGDEVQITIEGEYTFTGDATAQAAPEPAPPAPDKTGTTATASAVAPKPPVAAPVAPAAPVAVAPAAPAPAKPTVPSFTGNVK